MSQVLLFSAKSTTGLCGSPDMAIAVKGGHVSKGRTVVSSQLSRGGLGTELARSPYSVPRPPRACAVTRYGHCSCRWARESR